MTKAQKYQNTEPYSSEARYAEIMVSPLFANTRNEAFDAADGDAEVYSTWRQNFDRHLADIAVALSGHEDWNRTIWDIQHRVALGIASGEAYGPFSNIPFAIRSKRRSANVEAAEFDVNTLEAGAPNIVATNSIIVNLKTEVDDSIEFMDRAIGMMRSRSRMAGSSFEGPENYAAILKFTADKWLDELHENGTQKNRLKRGVNELMGNFLRVGERDTPNIIEITNVPSTIKNLPAEIVDERFSKGILKHTLTSLEDFSPKGLNLLLRAVSKMNLADCPELAAMTVDLAIRKGNEQDRSKDLLGALQAIAHLPKSSASERAFRSLLENRTALEASMDLSELALTNKLLRRIVNKVTESRQDSVEAKNIAEFVARRAVELYKRVSSDDRKMEQINEDLQRVQSAVRDFRSM